MICFFAIAFLMLGAIWQLVMAQIERKTYSAIGSYVDVGTYQMHYYSQGEGMSHLFSSRVLEHHVRIPTSICFKIDCRKWDRPWRLTMREVDGVREQKQSVLLKILLKNFRYWLIRVFRINQCIINLQVIPILILSSDSGEEWNDVQTQLALWSENSKQVIIKNSNHYIHWSNCDEVLYYINSFIEDSMNFPLKMK